MTTWQKTIKYIAMTLAIVLAAAIIGGIVNLILGLIGEDAVFDEMKTHTVESSEEITDLKVELGAAEFVIQQGDAFAVESNLKKLTVTTQDGTLKLKETTKSFRGSEKNTPKLHLTIPTDMQFNVVNIQTGAGTFTVEKLAAKSLTFLLGAGKVEMDNLVATESVKIDGGAGEITIHDGVLKNMDFDMGVGKLNLTAKILGVSELNCGVGETNVTLKGGRDLYTIKAEKGIGNAKIDGKSIDNSTIIGIGVNQFSVSGGIGAINVNFAE
ncbi:MAG: DUF4097 family beta strand repeat protein [Clostridia bacterium]|nr:DUF4097 family beta strand repeat protein [Clostridia bacterium]